MQCDTYFCICSLIENNTIIFSSKTDHKKYVLNISDLGVVFRSDLSFGLHIDTIYKKTRIKNLGFLMKNN